MRYIQSEVQSLVNECLNNPSNQCIIALGSIMQSTDEPKIRRIISLSLADIKNPIALPMLVNTILQKNTYKNGRASVVYACEEFDCTAYMNLFFNLALYDTAIVNISSIEIISKMNFKKINGCIMDYIDVLKNYISGIEDEPKLEILKKLLTFLEHKHVKCTHSKLAGYRYLDLF